MSAAAVDPPPLIFGQQSPSPPPVSSPPFSPNNPQSPGPQNPQITSQATVTVMEAEDVDMSTSTTLPPLGQNHDREAQMDDVEGNANSRNRQQPPQVAGQAANGAAVTEDVMDTTPDGTAPVLNDGINHTPSVAAGTQQTESSNPAEAAIIPADSNGGITEAGGDLPIPPPTAPNTALLPVPGSPQAIPPPGDAGNESDSSSDSEDDEPRRRWHEIREDTSAPDENELKEIERRSEVSALDHTHWEGQAFTPFTDPEYQPGVSGRIEWTIEHYNGTKEQPNKEVVMRSPELKVGDHRWRVKFYPRGNDTEFLSIYIECASLEPPTPPPPPPPPGSSPSEPPNQPLPSKSPRSTPLPLLPSVTVPNTRPSCLAQIAVVLYNPSEPRVNYHHTAIHRFSPGSPDWGWTRFHGPYYEIHNRLPGQRSALLRNDKLAMTAYIRLVDDETGVFGEHDDSSKQKWDSFIMTGLQGLMSSQIVSSANPGGNLISAIASWMLLRPFRELLYEIKLPDSEKEPRLRPKPMLKALQTIIYNMRSQVYPRATPVVLEGITDALEWYGIDEDITKLDVIQTWEILRGRVEAELAGTPWENRFTQLFGIKRDRTKNHPNYKVPVKSAESMQSAIESADTFIHPEQSLPLVLTVELDRQEFNEDSRTWKKLVNKVALDDHITLRDTGYTLYGFIAHKESLQSGLYYPVLRPEGPSGKWYLYSDARDNNKVTCLTKREALEDHEGFPASKCGENESSAVAYIALYVNDSIATNTFGNVEPNWDVPDWLVEDVERTRAREAANERIFAFEPPPPPPGSQPLTEGQSPPPPPPPPPPEKVVDPPRDITVQVIDSRLFLEHDGPGIFDAYSDKWTPETTQYMFNITSNTNESLKELRTRIAAAVKDIEDERQCKFWILDTLNGSVDKPQIIGVGNAEMSCGRENITTSLNDILEPRVTELRLWLHVMDVKDLPPLPKEDTSPAQEAQTQTQDAAAPVNPPENENSTTTAAAQTTTNEDTLMSDADEPSSGPASADPMVEIPGITFIPQPSSGGDNPFPIPPPFTFPTDTEMGGISENQPPRLPPGGEVLISSDPSAQIPPPLPLGVVEILTPSGMTTELQIEWGQPPPPPPPAPTKALDDLVYFFLKFFDAEKQTLECKGSYVVKNSARVDTTILKILDQSDDTPLNYFEEEDIVTANPIRRRRSFSHEDIHNANIIIVQRPLSDEDSAKLMGEGKCADPQTYLQYMSSIRNFPEYSSGTFTLDYFSAEYYCGDLKCGKPNGRGTRISHDNTKYSGNFVQGARHGKGHLTYANGDIYEGDFEQGLPNGQGTFTELATGNVYEGGWKAGKKFGEGITRWKVAQEAEHVCRICWEEEADSAFWDCGHVVACIGCARRVDVCPVCRRRVLGTCKLFYVS